MDVSASQNVSVQTVQQAPVVPNASASGTNSTPSSSDTADSVSVSAQAQAASAQTASTGTSTAPSPSLQTWSSPAVADALAALNDTSGKTSVDAQISAFNLMTQMVSDGSNFDPANANNANAADIATAFQTSTFAEHAQALADQMFAYNNQTGTSASEASQRKLDYFNTLSSDDQKTVLATMRVAATALGQQPVYASVDSYKAGMQATVDVDRAVEAAYANPAYQAGMAANMPGANVDANTAKRMALQTQAQAAGDSATLALLSLVQSNLRGDAFTAAANGYFTEYGPPPAATDAQQAEDAAPAPIAPVTKIDATAIRANYQALAALNDSSKTMSAADMVSLWESTNTNISRIGGPADLAHVSMAVLFSSAKVSTTIQDAGNTYDQASWAGRGASEASAVYSQIAAFNSLSTQDQQIVSILQGHQARQGDGTPAGYLSYLQTTALSAATQGDAIDAAHDSGNQSLYESLIAQLFKSPADQSSFTPSPKFQTEPGRRLSQQA